MMRFKIYTIEKGLIEITDADSIQDLTIHREDGPALICYYDSGNVEYEEYFINDKRHRLNGPAYIRYHENGNIKIESYNVNDKLHRLDGPAYIKYNEDGSIYKESYYINNIYYIKENYRKELLKLKVQSL